MNRTKAGLVSEHLERVDRNALGEYRDQIREFVRGRHGIYALYSGKNLYYVGLATDLRSRLKTHLKDRHVDGWNAFSLYLTTSNDHLRELEALVIRIATPTGNRAVMKFRNSKNLKRTFRRKVQDAFRTKLAEMFHEVRDQRKPTDDRRDKKRKPDRRRAPALAGYFKGPTRLRMTYKGKDYLARVRTDGQVVFGGKRFNSPSLAAIAVKGHSANGWHEWRYQKQPGTWVRLKELR